MSLDYGLGTMKTTTLGANSFLLEWTSFQKGTDVLESKQKVTKVISLVENGKKKYQYIHSSKGECIHYQRRQLFQNCFSSLLKKGLL